MSHLDWQRRSRHYPRAVRPQERLVGWTSSNGKIEAKAPLLRSQALIAATIGLHRWIVLRLLAFPHLAGRHETITDEHALHNMDHGFGCRDGHTGPGRGNQETVWGG